MALVYADRCKETSTTTGTGTYNLAGAVTGFQGFVAGIGTANTCYYAAENGTDWEVGLGTVTDAAPDTLARTTILASSNAGAAVNWAAGTRNIYCTIPASQAFNGDNITLFKALSADDAGGQDVATAQPWFPTAGAVTVEASTSYFFEGFLHTTRAAGVTSHTTSVLFGGTATLTSILYYSVVNDGDTGTGLSVRTSRVAVATATLAKGTSTSATEVSAIYVSGIIRINGAGTLIPQFQYSVAPGGAPTIKDNTHFKMTKIGTNTVTTRGTWA